MKPACSMETLLWLAEQTECHYQLKRIDPTDTLSTPAANQAPARSKAVRAVEEVDENEPPSTGPAQERPPLTCYACGKEGHFRRNCANRENRQPWKQGGGGKKGKGGPPGGGGQNGGQDREGGQSNGSGPKPEEKASPALKAPEPMAPAPARVVTNDPDPPVERKEGPTHPPPRAELVRMSERGWMAPVYINEVMVMLAVDTGASKTMLARDVFERHFKSTSLETSQSTFCTADGDELKVARQFVADVQSQ